MLPDGAFFVTLDGFLAISTPMKKKPRSNKNDERVPFN